jgi:hypothetical protein
MANVTVNFTATPVINAAKFLVAIEAENQGTLLNAQIGGVAASAIAAPNYTAAFDTQSVRDFQRKVKSIANSISGVKVLSFVPAEIP